MGIPKFFRWMSEKYPGLLETAKESQLPDIDNFYLDMNGIIHNCTHPCDGDVHFRISEAQMFEDIFNYINTLFGIIKPRQFFFMAVDGVAPRAKMNQQRGRRFRSAQEAIDREEAALKKGQILPNEQRFDSNCITPGTEFMVKLHNELQKYIQSKLATDPDWQNVKVILSGHETPGEGEHKVMDFIRHQRSQPDYDPNTRHCLYGLDTDLIMLGLSLHEPNFMLLREEMKFGGKKSDATKGKSQRVDPSKISFNVLYLANLRSAIFYDFKPLEQELRFKFDLEAIIDDWILICFLVGNDFIPHIPHFHIHKSTLPKIFEIYRSTLPKLNGYMNEKGILNLKRFKTFAKALAAFDLDNYKILLKENGGECAKDDFSKLNTFVRQKMRVAGIRDPNRDANHHRKSYSRPSNPSHHSHNHQSDVWYNIQRRSMHSTPKPAINVRPQNGPSNGRVGVHSFTEEQINNSITVCADGDFLDLSEDDSDDFSAYKRTYYREKLKLEPDKASILKVVHEYVRALQWNLHYYYHGCVSWGWFYPYHYAPFISDIANFSDVDTKFEMGVPFKPYDQLLSVLPAASSSLLPRVYRSLVTTTSSPLAKYFPTEVEYDLNGKQNDWEAVVLAPFIEEDVLLRASVLLNLFLSPEERANNNHGPHLLFHFVGQQPANGPSRRGISAGTVKCLKIGLNGFFVPIDRIRHGLLKKDSLENATPDTMVDNNVNKNVDTTSNHNSSYKHINNQGTKYQSSNHQGSNHQGSYRHGIEREGNNRQGIESEGNYRQGTDRGSNNRRGTDREGNNRRGTDREGNNRHGIEREGNNRHEIEREGSNRKGNNNLGSDRKSNNNHQGSDRKSNNNHQGCDRQGGNYRDDNYQGDSYQGANKQGSNYQKTSHYNKQNINPALNNNNQNSNDNVNSRNNFKKTNSRNFDDKNINTNGSNFNSNSVHLDTDGYINSNHKNTKRNSSKTRPSNNNTNTRNNMKIATNK